MYVSDGRLPEAEQAAKAALSIVQKQRPHNDVAEIGVRQNLASVLTQEGRQHDAEAELLQSWKLCQKSWSPDCPFSRNVARTLANCYAAQGKNGESAAIIQKTIQ